jgi:hypothetical protein
MNTYIKISTLEYPRYEGDIRVEHPEIQENQTHPNFPCPDTYALVEWVDMPTYDPATQIAYETTPVQVNGKWKMTWVIRDATASEIAMANTPKPDEFKRYYWDNETLSWIETT